MTAVLAWREVKPLALVLGPSGRVSLVADLRDTTTGDPNEIEALLVNSSHEWRQLRFDAHAKVRVLNNDALPALFSLLLRFPDTQTMGFDR